MPFKSEAQRRYLFMHEPKLAKKWAHKYGTPSNLPYHKKKKKKRSKQVMAMENYKRKK